jgi:hypothetical protein
MDKFIEGLQILQQHVMQVNREKVLEAEDNLIYISGTDRPLTYNTVRHLVSSGTDRPLTYNTVRHLVSLGWFQDDDRRTTVNNYSVTKPWCYRPFNQ